MKLVLEKGDVKKIKRRWEKVAVEQIRNLTDEQIQDVVDGGEFKLSYTI